MPAFAAPVFTPSVASKRAPKIVFKNDPNGTPAWAEIVIDGKITAYVYEECLIVTSVADAPTSTEIPATARTTLMDVYKKLLNGQMKLPYDKLGVDADKMSIRDLFDASFVCGDNSDYPIDHPEVLEPENVCIRLTFDVGVQASDKVYTMTYKNNEWTPVVATVNNGDGTVTCTFEKLCPVVFCVETADEGGSSKPDSPGTGDPAGENMILWIAIASTSLVAIAALVVVYRVKFSKK